MNRKTKVYTAECAWGCGRTVTSRRRIPAGGIGCGQGDCVEQHNASALQRLAEQSARRAAAAHARKDEPVQAWGDWGQLVAFSKKSGGAR